ncbi:excinuclease ABC subunit UvrB [Borrelia hermsii]|uniref:UvrABC system protein B n=3 Tax=Borrelia hermsii TaxID=140 RepID=A0AAN0X4R6_BORHE|nr:excinuclease ABC subunit UvrB [Borrelia hermsii]AAX17333.1 excinuclease ABC subunit B [Borrelia hermsii DAH]AJW73610.1 excinuclease ABC subunit B [Borrelia hermsii CC1]AMR75035.1 Excinuclease ABC subunit B / Nucleotide Excision Repair NER [Borrelia hermsii]ANA43636.1 excinuclease ABC subunit B [Borrelia hermsii HS1]UCP01829.1 excinuclease ABC subunit B [Borrelia hermsii]
MRFCLKSDYSPAGDQPKAIREIKESILLDNKYQTLKGVTGSGKTFTIANIIRDLERPSLIISHNKTLAAQLYREFKDFFPDNAVEYFVSYYDYYQPESYVPSKDLYIEKEATINEDIEIKRIRTVTSLSRRRDVIVVATVSSIYALGSPEFFKSAAYAFFVGQKISIKEIADIFVKLQYERTLMNLEHDKFSIKGDLIEIWPSNEHGDFAYRIYLDFDNIIRINRISPLTKKILGITDEFTLFAKSYFVIPYENILNALPKIQADLEMQYLYFKESGKLVEAERLRQRVEYDIEMLRETGSCQGIENYSKYFGDSEMNRPYCLFDFFPKDYLLFIDESHVTLPQFRGMYNGDYSRKLNLVNFGFRLPSALENRPLKYHEFEALMNQAVFVSATPGLEEREKSSVIVEQIIRPTGLVDPEIIIRVSDGQMEDLYNEVQKRIALNEKVLITTLTKKMAEDLTDYLLTLDIKARYLHAEFNAIERVDIITSLRRSEIDVIVGINLLREGLDIPEVSLVIILDADKVGFLRSTASLIQMIGRAARNSNGCVIMYYDQVSSAMQEAIEETNRRRDIQIEYNKKNNIVPKTIIKKVQNILEKELKNETVDYNIKRIISDDKLSKKDLIIKLKFKLEEAVSDERFEDAIFLRDKIKELVKG